MNKRGIIKKAVVLIILIAALALVGVLYILKSGAPNLEQLVEGEYSHIYDSDVREAVEDAFAQRPDELEWVWWDANFDGADDLILQEKTPCADGMKRIQGVFCVSDNKIICVMWDDVDVTEFYSVCNNKLVYYSQYLGTYTQKLYEVCEYDGDWNRETVSGLEFFYVENMAEMPADWTTEHPDIQAEGAYYQKLSVEENGEKVYTSLTVQEWCEEFEQLLGLPAPVDIIIIDENSVEKFSVIPYAENCNLYEDAGAEHAFPKTLITELSQAHSDGTVATFCDLHKADYKILTADEINAYIEKDQILYSFFAESKEESTWYEIALETAKDIVVCGEEYQYKFANAGRGADPGISLYGQDFYFVTWENANYIVSISENNKVYVHLFDNIVVGNVAVLEAEEDTVAVEYYRYETDTGVASTIEMEAADATNVLTCPIISKSGWKWMTLKSI